MTGLIKPSAAAAHVQEGKNRFEKPAPEATLFQSGEALAAEIALHRRLEYFPTPPWAVRAILGMGVGPKAGDRVLEPAAGRGHIVEPLRQFGCEVTASDIHDHSKGYVVHDFLGDPIEVIAPQWENSFDWMVTNPPFEHAVAFAGAALNYFAREVLMLCRLGLLCSAGRHEFHHEHLAGVYPFAERVPMALGRYDPKASTATEYAWYHFVRADVVPEAPVCRIIPPGQRERLFDARDVRI